MSEKNIVVTIGREYGSGGSEIGRQIAEKLGIKFYEEQLLQEAAEKLNKDPESLRKFEESKSGLDSFFGGGSSTPMDMPAVTYGQLDQYALFRVESKLIRDIAEKESCVIVGHCGSYVLKDKDASLRAFIYAPMEFRVGRVMADNKSFTHAEAERLIRRMDKNRQHYYEYYTDYPWGRQEGHDILIDSSILGIDGTADLLVDFIKNRS